MFESDTKNGNGSLISHAYEIFNNYMQNLRTKSAPHSISTKFMN